jgi:hypothetical protein
MAYVYRHIRLDKNEPFYIGIGTSEYYNRAYRHKNRSELWQRIAAKSGYEVEILMDNLTWEEACEKEKEFIALYGRKDIKTGCLANMTDGGDGAINVVISKEHREKIAEANRRRIFTEEDRKKMAERMIKRNKNLEFRTKLTEGFKKSEKAMTHARNLGLKSKGKKLSDLTKKKISDSKIKKPVIQYDLNGIFIKKWESVCQVEKQLNLNQSNIYRCCNGKYKQSYGFKWEYYNQ